MLTQKTPTPHRLLCFVHDTAPSLGVITHLVLRPSVARLQEADARSAYRLHVRLLVLLVFRHVSAVRAILCVLQPLALLS